jgi:hypothetical protein
MLLCRRPHSRSQARASDLRVHFKNTREVRTSIEHAAFVASP